MLYTLEGIPSKDTLNINGQPIQLRLGESPSGGDGNEDSEEEGAGENQPEAPEESLVVDDILLTKLTLRYAFWMLAILIYYREEHEEKRAAGNATAPAPRKFNPFMRLIDCSYSKQEETGKKSS